ncbi:hypothetical protein GF402_04330 [Candidatus Fermentibacteria bacterium]|nr:hypothetical protein [Candidatus Fermentibacteria bacterium]
MRCFLLVLAMAAPSLAVDADAGLDIAFVGPSRVLIGGEERIGFLPGVLTRVGLYGPLSVECAAGYWSFTPADEPRQQDPTMDEYRDYKGRLSRGRLGLRYSDDMFFGSAGVAVLYERRFWEEHAYLGSAWFAWYKFVQSETGVGPYLSGGLRIPAGPVDLEGSVSVMYYSLDELRFLTALGFRLI